MKPQKECCTEKPFGAPNRLTLLLIMGTPGSGKSTLAKRLLQQTNFVYLDNNFIADAFYPDTRLSSAYLEIRDNMYQALYKITAANLAVSNNVLIDAPHVLQLIDSSWVAYIHSLAESHGAILRAIWCYCSEPELRRRLVARNEARDKWKLDNWVKFISEQPQHYPIPFDHLTIDTEENIDRAAVKTIQWLNSFLSSS